MNETLRDLAVDASFYLQELRGRDIPYELAEILLRDWHTARLQALYGAVSGTVETFDGQHVRINRPSSPSGQPSSNISH
jgi:hypothetical protein